MNFHIKESVRVSPLEYMTPPLQPTDLIRLMRLVRRSGYRGFLPIETLSAGKDEPHERLKEVPLFLKKVHDAIAKTA